MFCFTLSKQQSIILSNQTATKHFQTFASLERKNNLSLKSSFRLMLLLSHLEFLIFIIVIREKIVLVRMRQAQKTQCLLMQYLVHLPTVAQSLGGTVRLKESGSSVTFQTYSMIFHICTPSLVLRSPFVIPLSKNISLLFQKRIKR